MSFFSRCVVSLGGKKRSRIDSVHQGRFVYYEGVRRKWSERLENLRARL
jgi:hypothetical protein